MGLPALLEDFTNLETAPAVREIVAITERAGCFDPRHRTEATTLIASMFLMFGAREDRIASYFGLDPRTVGTIGWRLRVAGIWNGLDLASDVITELEDESNGNIYLAIYVGVAAGSFFAARRDGQLEFSARRPIAPTKIRGAACRQCGGTLRYGQTGRCVACALAAKRKRNRRT